MDIELNKLASHLLNTSFKVRGVFHYVVEPKMSGWQKSSPFPGFIFPISGQAQFHFNGTSYLAQAGTVIHGGANMSLKKQVLGNFKWEYISVLYQVYKPEPDDFALEDTHFKLTIRQNPRLTQLLLRLWDSSNQPGSLSAFKTETLFRCVLDQIFDCAQNQTSQSAHQLFEQVSSYIHHHFMDTITVHSLAEQNNVNENRLYYVFNKYSGMGPGDYLMTYRLNRAKEMLITGNTQVGEIARTVGYPDALYFSRIFSKKFGISPSSMREKFSNNP